MTYLNFTDEKEEELMRGWEKYDKKKKIEIDRTTIERQKQKKEKESTKNPQTE